MSHLTKITMNKHQNWSKYTAAIQISHLNIKNKISKFQNQLIKNKN